jgi:hypothetical protein
MSVNADCGELPAARLLAAWESGLTASPVQRALTILNAVWSERSAQDWANVTIGARDALLIRVRERWFGEAIETVTACERCGERLESTLLAGQLLSDQPIDDGVTAEYHQLKTHGYDIRFRLPNSADLQALQAAPADRRNALVLLERCVDSARRGKASIDAPQLPPDVLDSLGNAMEARDPLAHVEIQLNCPACNYSWPMTFDIAAHLWGDIADWAERLLDDVHSLAEHYGWSETSILAMGATRRDSYLQRIHG